VSNCGSLHSCNMLSFCENQIVLSVKFIDLIIMHFLLLINSALDWQSPLCLHVLTSQLILHLSVSFPFSPVLLASSIFLLFHPFPFYQNSLRFQAGCRRRRLYVALVLCVLILCYMYVLVKAACLFLSYLI